MDAVSQHEARHPDGDRRDDGRDRDGTSGREQPHTLVQVGDQDVDDWQGTDAHCGPRRGSYAGHDDALLRSLDRDMRVVWPHGAVLSYRACRDGAQRLTFVSSDTAADPGTSSWWRRPPMILAS